VLFSKLTKLVWLVGPDGGDGEIDVLEGGFVVQLNVKMLICKILRNID
jgi:hypothetical protein